jgi:hypothetical protein
VPGAAGALATRVPLAFTQVGGPRPSLCDFGAHHSFRAGVRCLRLAHPTLRVLALPGLRLGEPPAELKLSLPALETLHCSTHEAQAYAGVWASTLPAAAVVSAGLSRLFFFDPGHSTLRRETWRVPDHATAIDLKREVARLVGKGGRDVDARWWYQSDVGQANSNRPFLSVEMSESASPPTPMPAGDVWIYGCFK